MMFCGLLLGALPLLVQDTPAAREALARGQADEARQKCAGLLEKTDGVVSVGMGGTGADYRLLVSVRDYESKERARQALGGDTFEGLKIHWWIRPQVSDVPQAPTQIVPPPASPTVAEPRSVPSGPTAYDCDVIRDHLKLKKISHPAGNGKYWAPCQIFKRTVEGGGFSPPPVLYAKHRPDCPVYLGQVGQPPVSDAFVGWVFQQGASVVTPAGTPQLSDLRPGLNPVPPPPAYPTYSYAGYYPYITWIRTYRGWIPYRSHYYYPGYCRFRRW